MLVHLFGARSSPSCSSFSLKKTAEDNRKYFNAETIDTVNRNFYVDDCLKSVASTDEAVQLVDQLPALETLSNSRRQRLSGRPEVKMHNLHPLRMRLTKLQSSFTCGRLLTHGFEVVV